MSLTFSSGPNCSTRARRTRRPANNQRTARRLTLEPLEERALLAVVSHWTAENTVLDSVGPNHGSLVSGAAYAAGQVNQAFSFDGVNDRVQVADSPSLALTQSMTIEAWVKALSLPTQQGMILFRGDDRGGLDPYELKVTSDGSLQFGIHDGSTKTAINAAMPLGQFVHVVGTLDHATGSMSLFINGVLMGQRTTEARPFGNLDPNSNPGIGIGNHGGYPNTPHNFPFHGLIDELKVYDNALTASEVLANFNATKGSLQPELSIADATAVEGDSSVRFLDAFVTAGSGGLNNARQLVFGADGNLFVPSGFTDSVLKYDGASGEFQEVAVPSGTLGLSNPWGMVAGPDGKIYVAGRNSDNILRYDPTTEQTETYVAPGNGLWAPVGLVFGADNQLYVANSDRGNTSPDEDQILRYAGPFGGPLGESPGDFLGVFVAKGSGGADALDNPNHLAFHGGHLYATNTRGDSVNRYDATTGAFDKVFVSPASGGLDIPNFLLFHDGLLYVVSQGTKQLLRYNASTGEFVDALPAVPQSEDGPTAGIVVGSDGHFYASASNEVLRYGARAEAVFKVKLNAPFPTTTSVDFTTVDNTALSQPELTNDFTVAQGTLTFEPGVARYTVRVPISNDTVGEPRETFLLKLSNPVNGTILDGSATGTIYDDDAGTKFYVVEDSDVGTRDRTFEYADGGRGIEDYVLDKSNTKPQGAASNAAGDTIWVADYARKVFIYNPVGGLKGSWTAGSMSKWARVAGIATNGVDVWLVDNYSRKVFKYTNAASRTSGSQNAANSFSLNSANTNPTDIVTDGTHLWVVDNGPTDKVYKYTLGGSLVSSWTIDPANLNPRGITLDPTNPDHLWIVDANQRRVYEYAHAVNADNGSIRRADASFALDSRNTHPEGIADPRPLLTQTSGSQSTDAIVAMAAGNTKPRGIADRPSGAREVTILTELFREFVLSHHAHLNGRQNVTGPALRPTSAAHASSIDMCNSWLLSVTDRIASTDREISGPLQHRTQNPARRIRDELLAAWDSDQDLLSNAWMEER